MVSEERLDTLGRSLRKALDDDTGCALGDDALHPAENSVLCALDIDLDEIDGSLTHGHVQGRQRYLDEPPEGGSRYRASRRRADVGNGSPGSHSVA